MKEAQPLCKMLEELKGSPTYKIIKVCDLVEVYSLKANSDNFNYCFDVTSDLKKIIEFTNDGVYIYGHKYQKGLILEEFISICKSHGVKVFWDTEVWMDKIITK